jgi:hypothetical protein
MIRPSKFASGGKLIAISWTGPISAINQSFVLRAARPYPSDLILV